MQQQRRLRNKHIIHFFAACIGLSTFIGIDPVSGSFSPPDVQAKNMDYPTKDPMVPVMVSVLHQIRKNIELKNSLGMYDGINERTLRWQFSKYKHKYKQYNHNDIAKKSDNLPFVFSKKELEFDRKRIQASIQEDYIFSHNLIEIYFTDLYKSANNILISIDELIKEIARFENYVSAKDYLDDNGTIFKKINNNLIKLTEDYLNNLNSWETEIYRITDNMSEVMIRNNYLQNGYALKCFVYLNKILQYIRNNYENAMKLHGNDIDSIRPPEKGWPPYVYFKFDVQINELIKNLRDNIRKLSEENQKHADTFYMDLEDALYSDIGLIRSYIHGEKVDYSFSDLVGFVNSTIAIVQYIRDSYTEQTQSK